MQRDAVIQANRLAALLSDARGTEILAGLQRATLLASRPAGPAAPASPQRPRAIGIWDIEPAAEGAALRRREVPAPVRRLWADEPCVPGKGGRSRVVVVGESTARGYLLDPVLTPTLALAGMLGQADRYQCVDLAKTGAEIREHVSLIRKLPWIEADWLVLLTGNNWGLSTLGVGDLDYLADAVRDGGAAALRTAVHERLLAPGIATLLDAIQTVHDQHGVRVVVVVPEFNLTGWEPESGCPYYARGLALAAAGDRAGARAALEESRDRVTGLLGKHTPRVTRYGQDALRGFAAANGHALVDLTTELADQETGLPDPGCFLDYCHLSATGMERAMSAVAGRLLAVDGAARPARAGLAAEPRPVAVGHLLAASHGAYAGQPASVVARQVAAALACDAGVRDELTAYLRLIGKDSPAWVCEEYDQLCRYPNARRYLEPTALQPFAPLGRTVLADVLGEALGEPARAPAIFRPSDRQCWSADLLAHRTDNACDLIFGAETAFFRSCAPVFTARAGPLPDGEVSLRLVYRTGSDAGCGQVSCDGEPLCPLPASPAWTVLEQRLPGRDGAGGVIEIAIAWPPPVTDDQAVARAAAYALALGQRPLLLTSYGELFEAALEGPGHAG